MISTTWLKHIAQAILYPLSSFLPATSSPTSSLTPSIVYPRTGQSWIQTVWPTVCEAYQRELSAPQFLLFYKFQLDLIEILWYSTYNIAQNFCRSLILWISQICKHLKYFNKHWTQFSHSDCKSIDGQHPCMGLGCQIHKELSQRRYLQIRHCFADSCKLEQTTVWLCMLGHRLVYYVCTVRMQGIREIILMNLQNITIRENTYNHPKFSATQ